MSLYIHIPFCHSKCAYCGFYSVASSSMRWAWLKALCTELTTRVKESSEGFIHETLYFGGGTPSMLSIEEWHTIIDCLERNYRISPNAERTLEANPEDITSENAALWRELGFNRLSIGVQSLNDRALKASNRRHSATAARQAIEIAHNAGFQNIGVDFIIGLPGSEKSDIELASKLLQELPITHVSLYILSIDEGSILYKKVQHGTFTPLSDDTEAELYNKYCQMIKSAGFEHYEISNFAKPGYRSRHNSAYWKQQSYMGFGAAAHSYDGKNCRRWNIANIKTYCEAWGEKAPSPQKSYESELLSETDIYNEMIMTGLRTIDGIPLELLESQRFKKYWNTVKENLQKYMERGAIIIEDDTLKLTEEGWLISDAIYTDLFY